MLLYTFDRTIKEDNDDEQNFAEAATSAYSSPSLPISMQANVLLSSNQPASLSLSPTTTSTDTTMASTNPPSVATAAAAPTASASSTGDSASKSGSAPLDLPAAQEYADRHEQHHPIAEFLYQLTAILQQDVCYKLCASTRSLTFRGLRILSEKKQRTF